MTSPDVAALGGLIVLVTAGAGIRVGVLKLIHTLHRRQIVRREEDLQAGFTRLTLDDGTTIEVPPDALLLYERTTVRRAAQNVVAPLRQEGIDELRIMVGGENVLTVPAADVDAFDVPSSPELALGSQELTMALTITMISFAQGNKWRLSDGERTFFATILDEDFLNRVDARQEAFTKGDILRCRVQIQQWQTETGLRAEWTVLEVLEHIPATRTLTLPLGSPSPSPGEGSTE